MPEWYDDFEEVLCLISMDFIGRWIWLQVLALLLTESSLHKLLNLSESSVIFKTGQDIVSIDGNSA